MLLLHESKFDLVEALDLFCHPQTNLLLTMVTKLQQVVLRKTPSTDSVEKVIFGHNTNEWTAASCIHEGIIRPSAVDPNELDWLPICLVGITLGRQPHATIHRGGVISEHAANLKNDNAHAAKEKRWALKQSCSRLRHVAVLLPRQT